MTSNDDQRKEMENTLNNFKANEEHYEMMLKNFDKMFYMRYKSLIEAGFTENQAFELVKARGLS